MDSRGLFLYLSSSLLVVSTLQLPASAVPQSSLQVRFQNQTLTSQARENANQNSLRKAGQNSVGQEKEKRNVARNSRLKAVLGSILNKFSVKDQPLGSRDQNFCRFTPGLWDKTNHIVTNKPIIWWRGGQITQIAIVDLEQGEEIWQKNVEGKSSVSYEGEGLVANRSYAVEFYQNNSLIAEDIFKVIDSETNHQTDTEILTLEAIEKLIQQGLLSDALFQVAYTVAAKGIELPIQEQILNHVCQISAEDSPGN